MFFKSMMMLYIILSFMGNGDFRMSIVIFFIEVSLLIRIII